MRRIVQSRTVIASCLGALVAFGATATAQFGSHPDEMKIDTRSYPSDVKSSYKVFANKCSECHGLDSSLKQTRTAQGWRDDVGRMQAMASSHINDREAEAIVKFLAYDESHRKAALRPASSAKPGEISAATGKQMYESYGCPSCHSVAGLGNTASALDGIGSKKSAEELKRLIVTPPAGSPMPAMEIPAKDLDNLVAYLTTLK